MTWEPSKVWCKPYIWAIKRRLAYLNEVDPMKKSKVHKVMSEFKHGKLHSGSKSGPKVKSRDQAIAIALSEQRKKKRS